MKHYKLEATTLAQVNSEIEKQPAIALYFASPGCGVCLADLPKVEEIAENSGIPLIYIDIDRVPEASGQLSVFTVPTVLLYLEQREYHRQSRFIDFNELNRRMREIEKEKQ